MRYMPTIRSGRSSSGSHKILARFDDFFNRFEKAYFDHQRELAEHENEALSAFIPDVDVEESETMFLITVDIPGLKSNEVRIDLSGSQLRISGERRRATHADNESYYERAHGKFQRSFTIPDNIDTNKITAHFDDGVLRVLLPKLHLTEFQEIKVI
ncbi:MAG: Hsp20/alpha crystallin family protein [Bdellovibrionales bacterium]|nr:Hsp20/alpha crystallin family protein [Bdellovibrionales bacterium]